jgi:hypothetical protein
MVETMKRIKFFSQKLRKQKYVWLFLYSFAVFFPGLIAVKILRDGSFPFWYDPARDLLLGLDNHSKISLIGPPSGIPGIFYGPYWIWILSLALFISKDPRIIIFLVLIIPYFIGIPFILFKLSKYFTKLSILSGWVLFVFSFGIGYSTSAWNPHLAPVLLVFMLYFFLNTEIVHPKRSDYVKCLILGGLLGFILNFHISLGIGLLVGIVFYAVIQFIRYHHTEKSFFTYCRKNAIFFICFLIGLFIVFIPFLIFELRHGFQQIQTIFTTLTARGSVVNVRGLSDEAILFEFAKRLASFLFLPLPTVGVVMLFLIFLLIIKIREFTEKEKSFLILLMFLIIGILAVYLSSKNPVWDYHLRGTEIIFLFFLLLMGKFSVIRYSFFLWAIIVVVINVFGFTQSLSQNPLLLPGFASKAKAAQLIIDDAKDKEYLVFAYNESIYTYEYAYLFKWLADKNVPFDPGNNPKNMDLVYLIIPPIKDELKADFINFRTKNEIYKTTSTWRIPDGTVIIRREYK